MGLLDALNSRDGMFGLALLDAAGARPVRTNIGAGLLQALGTADAFEQTQRQRKAAEEDRAQRQRMQDLQMQQLQQAMAAQQEQAAEQRRQRGQAQTDETLLRQSFAPLQGPTPDGAALMPNRLDPRFMLGQGASLAGVQNAMQLDQMLQPPKPKTMTLKPGEQVFSDDGKQLFGLPDKPEKPDLNSLIIQGPDGKPMLNQTLFDAKRRLASAGATSVSVNTGQKGFDNTLKLRGDFRSEPVYKAHQEMQSAHSQIQQALKQASPAGDLAGATKIMKLLDPGSVVRESELGMAMAASGLMDRLQNYAGNVMAGTKLTPTQRADFQRLADALYSESVKQYNGKRGEYQGIAERNGLSVPDVLGSPSAAPAAVDGWSIKRVP